MVFFFSFTNSFFGFRVERRREDPSTPKESPLTTLPESVPIDWFDPGFWNNTLTVRERIEYVQQGGRIQIALPAEEFCDTWEKCIEWKILPEDEFMKKYGDEVLAAYKIPTEEEIAQVQLWDEDEDEKASDDDDNILEIYD